jgi:hypothetical protein
MNMFRDSEITRSIFYSLKIKSTFSVLMNMLLVICCMPNVFLIDLNENKFKWVARYLVDENWRSIKRVG